MFLQYFVTVGWVFWPVKTVSRITYVVLAETLNHAQSISLNIIIETVRCISISFEENIGLTENTAKLLVTCTRSVIDLCPDCSIREYLLCCIYLYLLSYVTLLVISNYYYVLYVVFVVLSLCRFIFIYLYCIENVNRGLGLMGEGWAFWGSWWDMGKCIGENMLWMLRGHIVEEVCGTNEVTRCWYNCISIVVSCHISVYCFNVVLSTF